MNRIAPGFPSALRSSPLRPFVGQGVPRPNARRLLEGRGTYVDDVELPRMVHVAYLRSPHAHARIGRIDALAALDMPGVVAIVDGRQLSEICTPFVGTLSHFAGMQSASQHALAIDRACWQGEAVVAVVAETRARAEDAMQRIQVDWEVLPAVTRMDTALAAGTPVIHPELGSNLCFHRDIDTGGVDDAFAAADLVVEETYEFGRHTGVTMEPRSVLADFNPAERRLTVHHSHQAPHMMGDLYSRLMGIPEADVRVVCKDVGGSFGIKVHAYADDFATVALSILLGRPVKFVADRLESFVTDIHAREHRVKARLALTRDGRFLAFDIADLTGIGPYSVFPRTSAVEGNQVVNLCGGPYDHSQYRASLDVVFQNKVQTSQYRGVGHPIACAVTEGIIDLAATRLGVDPLELRRRNVMADDSFPRKGASGIVLENLSHQRCLDRLEEMVDFAALRREQAELRAKGVHRGIGIAVLIELTNPGAAFYGTGGARIASQDGATVRLDPTGIVHCASGVGEQGQGTETIFAQIVADGVGVPMDRVRVLTGDTAATPYGGGTWASRGAGIGGEAVLQASRQLRANILDFAAVYLALPVDGLDIVGGTVIDKDGACLIELAELGRLAHFRPDLLPRGFQPELVVTRHCSQRDYPFIFTNGIQVSHVEVDVETGVVTLLKHWVVEDCGRVINPLLVDEQIRGAVVQGLGGVLYEECLYDGNGLLRNGSMADYLVPMAGEMPDIEVAHVETPTRSSELGAKGAGEAGTAGAPAAVMNAINDALQPFSVRLTSHPITPEKILNAVLGEAQFRKPGEGPEHS
ncbi:carbon monoxide dehydrogenase [Azospirillum thiophilum]|uniref:Carbon monoxide dehydrogenase n=1 Tax=Azospirillum thiophilum TaxID=528244 RepID=A0AAC8W0L2_9PROT|nr:xanthine dehydrogenase family protein molybdopterin-binding subunit [Azospirillum thiophilum]ALG72959.1 carbon monoxide dehydrogenase [Azospirillum thiophilum]KJR64125.1 carbon monoxide dehydrogenase [Azospirillum thiophilum]